jgi:4-hydroxybenzoate polyprenyltransferase
MWTLLGSTLLGTAYSLPPLRLKRFPLLAGLC